MTRFPRFSPNVYQIGLSAALVSLSAFFIALILAYSFRIDAQPEWRKFQVPSYLWVSTLLLGASSAWLEAAKYSLRRAAVGRYRARLRVCIGVGSAFLVLQTTAGRDLIQQGVATEANPHGSAFYMFMGIHAAHLIVGLVWLAFVDLRSRALSSEVESDLRKRRILLAVAAVYWHFMGAVWAVLFFFLLRWTGA